MSTVFISYSHVDAETADQIADVLGEIGVPFFRDVKDVEWGSDIEQEVRRALFNCAAGLDVVSAASLKFHWVPYELGHGSALLSKRAT